MKYRIIKREYVNKYGGVASEDVEYFVQYCKKNWFGEKWEYVTHLKQTAFDFCRTNTSFQTYEMAYKFAEEFIVGNKPYGKYVETIVSQN